MTVLTAPVLSLDALQPLLSASSHSVRSAAAATISKLSIKANALKEGSDDVSVILNTVLSVLKAAVAGEDTDTGTYAQSIYIQEIVDRLIYNCTSDEEIDIYADIVLLLHLSECLTVEDNIDICNSATNYVNEICSNNDSGSQFHSSSDYRAYL